MTAFEWGPLASNSARSMFIISASALRGKWMTTGNPRSPRQIEMAGEETLVVAERGVSCQWRSRPRFAEGDNERVGPREADNLVPMLPAGSAATPIGDEDPTGGAPASGFPFAAQIGCTHGWEAAVCRDGKDAFDSGRGCALQDGVAIIREGGAGPSRWAWGVD